MSCLYSVINFLMQHNHPLKEKVCSCCYHRDSVSISSSFFFSVHLIFITRFAVCIILQINLSSTLNFVNIANTPYYLVYMSYLLFIGRHIFFLHLFSLKNSIYLHNLLFKKYLCIQRVNLPNCVLIC